MNVLRTIAIILIRAKVDDKGLAGQKSQKLNSCEERTWTSWTWGETVYKNEVLRQWNICKILSRIVTSWDWTEDG
jgi:hypothetical protein